MTGFKGQLKNVGERLKVDVVLEHFSSRDFLRLAIPLEGFNFIAIHAGCICKRETLSIQILSYAL
jgi:hypothetical protein